MKELITMRNILLLACCMSASTMMGQQRALKQADKEFADLKYRAAVPLYLNVIKKDSLNKTIPAKLGDCFRKLRDPENAAIWYQKAVALDTANKGLQMFYAAALAGSGRYAEAAEWYGRNAQMETSQAFLKSYKEMNSLMADSASWQIGYLNMNSGVDDFGPAVFNQGLLFVSNRGKTGLGNELYGWDQTPYLNIFYVRDVASLKPAARPEWEKPPRASYDIPGLSSNDSRKLAAMRTAIPLPVNVDMLKDKDMGLFNRQLNTRFHEGPVSFNSGQDTIWLSVGKPQEKLAIKCAIYRYGDWKDAGTFPLNSNDYSVGHPALHPDGNVMYFVSDMPGGKGGTDIYYSFKTPTGWAAPQNAGPLVNSAGNEMFPYISPAGDLYFSSDGKGGLGGLDVFKTGLQDYLPVKESLNLGYPVNSSKDDFGVWVNKDGNSGYFSSNRYASDDVFMFRYLPGNVKK